MPRWMEEIFKITAVQPTNSVTYHIKDLNSKKVEGSVYGVELHQTVQEIFWIDVIRCDKNSDMALLKWKDHSPQFNQWGAASSLVDLH